MCLRGACEGNAREMTPSGNKIDFDFELDSRLAFDERLRFCTKRASRPIGSRFETRCLARCSASEVFFVRSGAFQGGVRSLAIVPVTVKLKFVKERAANHRHDWETMI